MEFFQAVDARRSIRSYTDEAVSEEQLEALLEAARLCQSAKNRQPWRFMALRGGEKDGVARIMLDLFEKRDVELPGYVNSSKSSAHIIENAPVLILVFRDRDPDWNTGDLLSIGAAIEHICLGAAALGLGAVWIRDTVYTQEEIAAYAGWPELELVSALALGHPAEHPDPRPRKPLGEILLERRKP